MFALPNPAAGCLGRDLVEGEQRLLLVSLPASCKWHSCLGKGTGSPPNMAPPLQTLGATRPNTDMAAILHSGFKNLSAYRTCIKLGTGQKNAIKERKFVLEEVAMSGQGQKRNGCVLKPP